MMPAQLKERSRYGGNYLNVKGEEGLEFQPFYLFVSGHVQSGEIDNADGICCKYDYIAGTDWSIVEVKHIWKLNYFCIG